MANLAYTLQSFVTQTSNCKVLLLWNGVSNDAAPTDWEQPGFNDSGWAAPVAQTTFAWSTNPHSVATSYAGAGYGPFATPFPLAPSAGAATHKQAAFLMRWTFTAPADPWQVFIPEYKSSPSGLDGFYAINGHLALGEGFYNAEVNQWITPGATVVIALSGQWTGTSAPQPPAAESRWSNGGGGTAPYDWWLAGRISFYIPTPTTAGGQVYSWGTITAAENDKGVLGTGDTVTHLTPTPMDMAGMPSPRNAAKVVSNGKTTLVLTLDGYVYGCGDNSTGLLGNNTTDTSVHASPAFITLGIFSYYDIVDISIGDDCAMAIDRFGHVYMWGPNAHGSLGRGDTTPQYSPVTPVLATYWYIACGRDYSVRATQSSADTAGGNTYGQLGQGTSGADVTTRAGIGGFSGTRVDSIAAGDAQTIVTTDTDQYVFGRADFGSLANTAYNTGTGPNKIVSTPINVTGQLGASPQAGFNRAESVQSGSVTYSAEYALIEGALVMGTSVGDGRPYGGTGVSDSDVTVYGIDPVTYATFNFFTVAALATNSAASQNDYTVGTSKVVGGWVGTDGKLYTFGWGGAGQMGSGADPTTNKVSTSINGLTQVVAATVCRAGMFAISLVLPSTRARSTVQWVG